MKKLIAKYNKAKSAKVGETITCPSCNTQCEKTHYAQAFCKSRGGTKCKDKYWNTVTPEKRNNTTRISPANQRWQTSQLVSQGFRTKEERELYHLDDDGTWEAHQAYVEPCEFCGLKDCECPETPADW